MDPKVEEKEEEIKLAWFSEYKGLKTCKQGVLNTKKLHFWEKHSTHWSL